MDISLFMKRKKNDFSERHIVSSVMSQEMLKFSFLSTKRMAKIVLEKCSHLKKKKC